MHANEAMRRWPGMGGEEDWQAVIEKNAGFLRVEACVEAHLESAKKLGAQLQHSLEVQSWRSDGDSVEVRTTNGVERAARLLIASGPWSHQAVPALQPHLRILLKQQYWMHPSRDGMTLEDGFPCFFHETPDGFFYGFPAMGDSGVKVARHSGGIEIDSPTPDVQVDKEDRRLVDTYLRKYMPGVQPQLVSQAKCYYSTTPDEHFIVDRLPQDENVTVVAGLSGHGFKFTSVLGEIAGRLTVGGQPGYEIDLFRLNRF